MTTKTSMKPFPAEFRDENELTEAVTFRLGRLLSLTRRAISEFEHLDDPVTVHHLMEAAATVEKHVWIIESHIRPN